MKIRLVAAELFHADGQTDMTKLTLANAPKNTKYCLKTAKRKKEEKYDIVHTVQILTISIFTNQCS